MKHLNTLLFAMLSMHAVAQYCGNSGASVCNPNPSFTGAGFPNANEIPCIVQGEITQLVIPFNFNSQFVFGGQTVTVQTLTFDTISNLPNGLCFATNASNNTFVTPITGCLKISGTTFAQPGQYKLYMVVTANIGVPVQTNADATGLYLFLRVIPAGSAICPDVDTTQSIFFAPYAMSGTANCIVSGKIYYDYNSNQVYDGGDAPAINQLINADGAYSVTSQDGDYMAYADTGIVIIHAYPSNPLFTISPSSLQVSALIVGAEYGNNNFAITIPAGYCEGSLNVTTTGSPPRPGFTNTMYVKFDNNVSYATSTTQEVRLFYDPAQSFVYANPAPAVIDTIQHILQWNTGPVLRGSSWAAAVTFQTALSAQLGTTLAFSGTVLNSTCGNNDILNDYYETTVVGSFDPNDKAVSPVGKSDNHGILQNQLLKYKVRFQNTGTFLAERVVIVDTLSPYLNVSSLKVLDASHNYEVVIENGNIVKFVFDHIMLPDSFSNEPESHGYIQFSLEQMPNLPNGTYISNVADIYFDFNSPIRTNTVYNTIDLSVGIQEEMLHSLKLIPNPHHGFFKVSGLDFSSKENYAFELYNLNGQMMQSGILYHESSVIETSGMAQGIYMLHLADSHVKVVVK